MMWSGVIALLIIAALVVAIIIGRKMYKPDV